jgi:hypothetical protein
MTSSKLLFSILIYLLVFSWDCLGQAVKDSVWIQTKEGCKVYNPRPQKNETITWTGECSDGYASGAGTLTWFKSGKQNQQYVGHMKRGMPNGIGKYAYSSGTVYEGFYVNGRLDGVGQVTKRDKGSNSIFYVFNGQLKDSAPDGYGEEIYFYSEGDTSSIYKGNFSDWDRHGSGLLKEFHNNATTIVKGYFNQNKVEGKAEIWYYHKDKLITYYIGDFRDAGRNGHGVEVWGVNKYVGNWVSNEKNGKGKLFLDSLLIYEGDWINDQFNGIGKRFFFDGSYYFGEFKNDRRNGLGIQYWKNGTKYVGEFKKDLLAGSGYIIKENKIGLSGIWVNGSLTSSQEYKIVKKRLKEKYNDKPRLNEILPD